jgi:endonuclease YncB( thermonuclease family)
MQRMKTKTMGLMLVVSLAIAAVCFAADDPMMGTWKLNEAKSKIAPGAPKNMTVTYAAAGDQIKVTVDGTDADGKPAHSEWTGKFDGKDYPVTGDATADMRSYKKEGKDALELTNKKDGKVTVSGKVVVSADGKTRTVTLNGTDAKGAKVTSTAVYDKS